MLGEEWQVRERKETPKLAQFRKYRKQDRSPAGAHGPSPEAPASRGLRSRHQESQCQILRTQNSLGPGTRFLGQWVRLKDEEDEWVTGTLTPGGKVSDQEAPDGVLPGCACALFSDQQTRLSSPCSGSKQPTHDRKCTAHFPSGAKLESPPPAASAGMPGVKGPSAMPVLLLLC